MTQGGSVCGHGKCCRPSVLWRVGSVSWAVRWACTVRASSMWFVAPDCNIAASRVVVRPSRRVRVPGRGGRSHEGLRRLHAASDGRARESLRCAQCSLDGGWSVGALVIRWPLSSRLLSCDARARLIDLACFACAQCACMLQKYNRVTNPHY
jgi:hypothetical protein